MALLRVLTCFEQGAETLTAAEIVALSGLPRSSAFRAIRAVHREGFVYQDPATKRYALGPRMLRLGAIARRQLASELIVAAPLIDLAKRTGETVTYSLVDVPWRIAACVVEGSSDLREVVQPGARYPLHLGAAGKVILANLPDEVVRSALATYGLPRATVTRVTRALSKIKSVGYAFTSGERIPGASGVAAPVFLDGHIFGSVAVVGPSDRMKPTYERHRPKVLETAAVISQRLESRSRAEKQGPRGRRLTSAPG